MFVGLLACLALAPQLEPDSAFVGTWELVALSQAGRPRPGQGLLVVVPGRPGQPARWTWDLPHQPRGDLVTTRKPGNPWPIISRHTPSPRFGSFIDRGGDGFYHLAGDTLTVVILSPPVSTKTDEDVFRPAFGRTIETYRRVAKGPDPSFRPSPFPKGPVTLIACWDEAWHGTLQGPPRGTLNHYAAYDLGEGVRVIRNRGTEFLDDPPAPDLDPKDVPSGTMVRPPGGRFDDKTYEVTYPALSPEARAIIDAFRAQNPDVADRRVTYAGLFVKSTVPGNRFFGWDGVLLTTRSDGDRTVAEVLFRPRLLGMSGHGTRTLENVMPPLLETWEFRDGKLRYLGGGPEELERRAAPPRIPPEQDQAPTTPRTLRVRPRPLNLPPVPNTPVVYTLVHYRPDRIDLEDSTKNSTDAGAPPPSSPEFTIHHAFSQVPVMSPPAAREAYFADVLAAPGRHLERWDAVIRSAVPEGDDIRAEILVWPLINVPVRPFLETWIYRDQRLSFVSGKPASQTGSRGR
jgi:hypothetical protein